VSASARPSSATAPAAPPAPRAASSAPTSARSAPAVGAAAARTRKAASREAEGAPAGSSRTTNCFVAIIAAIPQPFTASGSARARSWNEEEEHDEKNEKKRLPCCSCVRTIDTYKIVVESERRRSFVNNTLFSVDQPDSIAHSRPSFRFRADRWTSRLPRAASGRAAPSLSAAAWR